MNRIAKRATALLVLVGLLFVGLFLFVGEFITKADDWVAFQGSPHMYDDTGEIIKRGSIVDRSGVLLLDVHDEWKYSNSETLRKATVHWVGDREGQVAAQAITSRLEQTAKYDLINGAYSYSDDGSVVKLTLSAQVQMAALEALGDRRGTVAVYNYKTGQILCAVTSPNFDPDNLPSFDSANPPKEYQGLYWNNFTQGTYTPGSIFKIVTLASVVEAKPEILQEKFTCRGKFTLGPDDITCEAAHGEQDVKTAFKNSCNCAFAQIVLRLGGDTLQQCVDQFKVTESLTFDGITTETGTFVSENVAEVSAAWAGIGQYLDQVNPCAFMTFMGAIAGGGQGAQPYIVQSVSDSYQAKTRKGERIMSKETAELLTEYLRNNVENKYGDSNFPGLTVCAKTGTGEVGGGQRPNAMLAGFVLDTKYPLAFVVCVEDAGYGGQVCLPIASQVLTACKETLS